MLEKIKYYLQEDLWNFPLNREKGWRHFGFKWLRIAYLTAHGFYQNNCGSSASSLTYYTLMSIVPVFAVALAIAHVFGFNEMFRVELLQRFPEQNEALAVIFKFAAAFLVQARGGTIAAVALIILFLSATFILSGLENTLNLIWRVKKFRSWKRILSDYVALLLIVPIFFVIASSASFFVVDLLEIGIRDLPVTLWLTGSFLFLVNVIPYCLFWALFTFIYFFMPNTRVHFRSACLGGLFTGCLYMLLQWAYLYFQIGVVQYGAVYGSMAALPLFLTWVQLSWFLFFIGAEISCAHQTLDEHEFEARSLGASHNFKRLLSLWVVHLALKEVLTREILVKKYHIPNALVIPILQELIDCHLLQKSKGGYVPDRNAQDLRVSDVLEALDARGENEFPYIESRLLAPFEKALDEFRAQIKSSPHNIRLSHVSHSL